MPPTLWRFAGVTLINGALDVLIYLALTTLLGAEPVIASTISTGFGIGVSFVLNYFLVFRSRRSWLRVAGPFVVVTLGNAWITQNLVIWIVVSASSGSVLPEVWVNLAAKGIALVVGACSNYLLYRHFFNGKEEGAPQPEIG